MRIAQSSTPQAWLLALIIAVSGLVMVVTSFGPAAGTPTAPIYAPAEAPAAQTMGLPASQDDPSSFEILVLGDSYSAGNGAGDYEGAAGCWRSRHNYGMEFARLIRAKGFASRVNVETKACSGAVTADFFASKSGRAPMLDAIKPKHDLIMLTIGGNDVHFKDIVTHCLVRLTRTAKHCRPNLDRAEALVRDGQLATRLTRVLRGIAARAAPGVKVVLLGYPLLEGKNSPLFKLGKVEVAKRVRELGRQGERLQARVVRELHSSEEVFVHVPTSKLFAGKLPWLAPNERTGHELLADGNNPKRWMVKPFADAKAAVATFYHPNPTGWRREAELLLHDPRVPRSSRGLTLYRTSGPAGYSTYALGFTCPRPAPGTFMHTWGHGADGGDGWIGNGDIGDLLVNTSTDARPGTYTASLDCVQSSDCCSPLGGAVVKRHSFIQRVTAPARQLQVTTTTAGIVVADGGGCQPTPTPTTVWVRAGYGDNIWFTKSVRMATSGRWPEVRIDMPGWTYPLHVLAWCSPRQTPVFLDSDRSEYRYPHVRLDGPPS